MDFVSTCHGLATLVALTAAWYEARRCRLAVADRHAASKSILDTGPRHPVSRAQFADFDGELRPDDGLLPRFERLLRAIELALPAVTHATGECIMFDD